MRTTTSMFGLAAALLLSGCSMFQFHGTITKTKTVDGQTVTTTEEFDDWQEMKAAMDKSFKELRGTTKELLTKLVEAPPPGEVHLADLSPGLADYEGNSNLDSPAPVRKVSARRKVPSQDVSGRGRGRGCRTGW